MPSCRTRNRATNIVEMYIIICIITANTVNATHASVKECSSVFFFVYTFDVNPQDR